MCLSAGLSVSASVHRIECLSVCVCRECVFVSVGNVCVHRECVSIGNVCVHRECVSIGNVCLCL